MKKWNVIMTAVLLFFAAALPPVFGAEGTASDYGTAIATKFGRGLWNVVSSPAEIPCTIGSELSERPAAGFLTGLGLGTVYMLRRILVGASEVGTFMIPMEATIPQVCAAP